MAKNEAAVKALKELVSENYGEIVKKSFVEWFNMNDPSDLARYWNLEEMLAFIDSPPINDDGEVAFDENGIPIRNHEYYSRNPQDPAYAAPETVSGSPPDEVSAIYSMGLILYELLVGDLETAWIKRPSEVMGDVPEWLDGLTMRCIAKDRSGRFQGIGEIFSALKGLKGRA